MDRRAQVSMAAAMLAMSAVSPAIAPGPPPAFGGYGGRGAINGGGRVKDTQSPVRVNENREQRRAAKKARKKQRRK